MKDSYLFFLTLIVLFSCTQENADSNKEGYYLSSISGGVAGVQETFTKGEVVWIFENDMEQLTIKKNTTNTISGLPEGNYQIDFLIQNGHQYITANNNELGEVSFSLQTMSIDGNSLSTGSGADFYIYNFKKY